MGFLDDQAGLVASDIARLISVGDIIMSVTPTPRDGFLLCDWSLLDSATYPELYAKIGTAFNIPGDPVGFFRIPPSGGLSPMGAGSTTGYTTRALGAILGEENHVLTVPELASHTHVQDSHNHTQNSHNHTQDSHTHAVTDVGHTHTQDSHNHTQNSHTHTQNIHYHTVQRYSNNGAIQTLDSSQPITVPRVGVSAATTLDVDGTVAVNQSTTAVNQAATATNNSATTGIVNQSTTATNQATTATNNTATATNQSTGSSSGHNTIHPVVCWYFLIRYH